jgi:hypothetical protein
VVQISGSCFQIGPAAVKWMSLHRNFSFLPSSAECPVKLWHATTEGAFTGPMTVKLISVMSRNGGHRGMMANEVGPKRDMPRPHSVVAGKALP